MAIEDWDLNLFTSDPTLLERASDEEYERAAAALERIADPRRLRLLHALSLGEDTAQRAAVWAGIEQSYDNAVVGRVWAVAIWRSKTGT